MSTTIIYFNFTAIYYYNCTIKIFFQAIFQLKEFSEKLFFIFTGLVTDMFLSRHHFLQLWKKNSSEAFTNKWKTGTNTHTYTPTHRYVHQSEDSRIISQMMSRYGINCQHFLVGWSCGQHEPMSPGGIFSSTDLLNIKHPHTNTFTCAYTNFAQLVHAKKNKKHSTEFTVRLKRLLAPLVQSL